MSSKKKPFEQYSYLLRDGRRVVMVALFEPRRATLWLVAAGKGDALRRARELGARDPHIVSDFRPLGIGIDAAANDPNGGVFVRNFLPDEGSVPLPLADLRDYLEGTSRAY